MKAKLAVFFFVMVCVASLKSQAQILILSGTESETIAKRDGRFGPENFLNANAVYLVYETGTGKAAVFRATPKYKAYLRTNVTLLEIFGHNDKGSATFANLSNGSHSQFMVSSTIFKGTGVRVSESKVPFGLPNGFPLVLTEREDVMIQGSPMDNAPHEITHRAATLVTSASLTKESYTAHDTFDQAAARVKAKLDAKGYDDLAP